MQSVHFINTIIIWVLGNNSGLEEYINSNIWVDDNYSR